MGWVLETRPVTFLASVFPHTSQCSGSETCDPPLCFEKLQTLFFISIRINPAPSLVCTFFEIQAATGSIVLATVARSQLQPATASFDPAVASYRAALHRRVFPRRLDPG